MHLLMIVGVAIASAPVVAQQGNLRQSQSDELTSDYQAWQQAGDTEAKIGLGEHTLALEPTVAPWSLQIPRQRFKAELSAGLGGLYRLGHAPPRLITK
jgi:hypothetical protein